MKPGHSRYSILLVLALAGTSLADPIHVYPYKMSPQDLAAVEAAACTKPYGLKLDSALAYDLRGDTSSNARCRSHDTVDRRPLHYLVYCGREPQGWRCTISGEYLRTKIDSKEIYLGAPRERLSEALGAMRYLVKTGKLDPGRGGISSEVELNRPTIYHVHAEPAGARALRFQQGFEWLYVERVANGGYREVPQAEAAALAADINERRDARGPVYDFFYGHHTGNPEYFRNDFLPTARIEGTRDGKFVSLTIDEYCALFDGKPAEDEGLRERSIEHSDISGDTAIVKATLDHGATMITNFFVLLKVDGKWKIANAVQSERAK